MATKNDITGDEIKTGVNSDAYRNSPYWDRSLEPEKDQEIWDRNVDALKNVVDQDKPKDD